MFKRLFVSSILSILVVLLVGCTSITEKAEKMVEEGNYIEAISLLEEEESEEVKAIRNDYIIQYAESFALDQKYKEAIEVLEVETFVKAKEATERYVLEYADQLANDEQYKEAIDLLYKYRPKNMDEIIDGYIDVLIEKEKYQEAKELLLKMSEDSFDQDLFVQCNIGIMRNYINENGSKGDTGKRVYVKSGDGIVYLEDYDGDTLVLGYTMENSIGGNNFKLYITLYVFISA